MQSNSTTGNVQHREHAVSISSGVRDGTWTSILQLEKVGNAARTFALPAAPDNGDVGVAVGAIASSCASRRSQVAPVCAATVGARGVDRLVAPGSPTASDERDQQRISESPARHAKSGFDSACDGLSTNHGLARFARRSPGLRLPSRCQRTFTRSTISRSIAPLSALARALLCATAMPTTASRSYRLASFAALSALAVLATASPAHAEWADSRVPEGDTAFTLRGGDARVSILGRSAVGLSDRVELSTYFPLYFLLLPNFSLKWRFHEGEEWATSIEGTVVAGAYPVAVAAAFLPGVAVGGAGLVLGSYQSLALTESYRPSDSVVLSLSAGVIGAEVGFVGAGGVVGAGGAAATPITAGGSDSGGRGGAQVDVVLRRRDLLSFSVDAWWFRRSAAGFALALAGWTHAWKHFHLTAGLYSVTDLPDAKTLAHSKLPVGPYANVYFTF